MNEAGGARMPSPEKFHETLAEYGIAADVIAKIDEGYEHLTSKSKKDVKARFFTQALAVMEQEISLEQVRTIFEANGCCKTGARLKASKAFARINAGLSLEEKLAKIRRAHNIVICAVQYRPGEHYACACPTISRQTVQPHSKNYCYCCAGHFKFHYEIMLDCRLRVEEIVSSPLDSDGQEPCVMRFSLAKE